jgi:hypothetical protein
MFTKKRTRPIYHPPYNGLVAHLKLIRKNQSYLAELLNQSEPTISAKINGYSDFSYWESKTISDDIGLPISNFFIEKVS